MDTRPPNFKRSYPLAGETVGWAWGLMWQRLTERSWVEGISLADEVAPMCGAAHGTVLSLLYDATRHGVLESQLTRNPKRKRDTAHYRVRLRRKQTEPGYMPAITRHRVYGGVHFDD